MEMFAVFSDDEMTKDQEAFLNFTAEILNCITAENIVATTDLSKHKLGGSIDKLTRW